MSEWMNEVVCSFGRGGDLFTLWCNILARLDWIDRLNGVLLSSHCRCFPAFFRKLGKYDPILKLVFLDKLRSFFPTHPLLT